MKSNTPPPRVMIYSPQIRITGKENSMGSIVKKNLLALLMVLAASCVNQADEVTPQELHQVFETGRTVLVLDVREPDEWMAGHMIRAQSAPLSRFDQASQGLRPEQEIYLYCHSGKRSMTALQMLKQRGFTHVKSLSGGIQAWKAQVDPALNRY